MSYKVTLIPGDGIGPEVSGAAQRVLDASGVVRVRELHGITWEELEEAHPGVRFEKLED